MLTWHAAAVRSQVTVRRQVATNVFRPSESFAAAFERTDPLLQATVPQEVSLKLAGCCE